MILRKADRTDIEELVRIRLAYLKEDCKELTEKQSDELVQILPSYFYHT